MTDDRNTVIRQLRRHGATLQQIADRFAVTRERIGQILQESVGERRRHGWPCPDCGSQSRTVQTRSRVGYVYRRHECRACLYRWTTNERPVLERKGH